MTKRVFWDDPYQTECEAKVVRIEGNNVIVDRTIFFAFAGGQATDSGTIGGISVAEAKDEKKEIVYVLEQAPNFSVGDSVKIKIDWKKRYALMKLHTAVHILWFLFQEKTGTKEVVGSNIAMEKGRMDFAHSEPVTPLLPELEQKLQALINQNLPIMSYGDTTDPEKQWWECGKWKCPCCGTHPKSTGEIGRIKLKRVNPGKGKERIEVLLSA